MSAADNTYIVTVRLTVHEDSSEYLQSVQAITEEFESWLEDLRATVHTVDVRREEER